MHAAGPIKGTQATAPPSAEWALGVIQRALNNLADGTITTLTGDVTGGPPVAGVLTTAIELLAVTTPKIANAAVTTLKLGTGVVTGVKIATGAVGSTHIANLAISNIHIATAAGIDLGKLAIINEGALVGRKIGGGSGVPEEVTVGDLGVILNSALDPTLVAFQALTIAANSITIGTGADAFTQLTLPANTFPARSNIGNVSAKTVTNFAISLLDDTDAATMRNTLGVPIGTGSGVVVFDVSPTITTPTLQGSSFGPACAVVVSGNADGVQMQSMFQPSLPNGNRNFFSLGKAWGSGTACFLGYCLQATAANQSATIGFWGDYGVFTVFQSGACVIGSQTSGVPANPGANRFVIQSSLTPSPSTATGVTGTIAWDSGFIYVCVGTNSWKRAALAAY